MSETPAVAGHTAPRERTLRSLWWVPTSLVIGLLTWPVWSTRIAAGLDPSWKIALHLAASQGLNFGPDFSFTYGPLGFLSQPVLVTATTGALALLYLFAARLALSVLLLRSALHSVPPVAAVAVAYVALAAEGSRNALDIPEYLVFFVLFLAVWMLERAEPAPAWVIVLGAVVAAAALCVKLNGGVLCFGLLLIACWRARPGGLRSVGVLIASYVAALAAIWLLTGNRLTDLPTWIRLSAHIVTSYTASMQLEGPGRLYEYPVAAAVVVLGLVAVLLRARPLGRARAGSLAAVWVAYSFVYLKEGFVRHDGAHTLITFTALAIGLLAFTWRGTARMVAGAAFALAIVGVAVSPGLRGRTPTHPQRSVVGAATDLADVIVPHRLHRAIAANRARARMLLGLDPSTLAELRGRTVDVEPYEIAAVWAYGLRWRPEPLVQGYIAGQDDALDAYNAKALADRGASRVLREQVWPALDHKQPLFVAPATFRTLVCHYREIRSDGRWEVLARAADRCGAPRLLGSVSARPGQVVAVPPAPGPRDVVFARIHVRQGLVVALEKLLLKVPFAHQPAILLDGEHYRLTAATASGPLILRMPPSAGMSAAAGGAVNYSRLSLLRAPYRVDFYALPLTQAWRAATPPGKLTASSVTVGGQRAPLARAAVQGAVETVSAHDGIYTATGWASDLGAGTPAREVALFGGGRLLGWTRPSIVRPDVAAYYRSSGLTRSGFSLTASLREVQAARGPFRVVALDSRGDAASLLPGDAHP